MMFLVEHAEDKMNSIYIQEVVRLNVGVFQERTIGSLNCEFT
jgi:hypothetical protein